MPELTTFLQKLLVCDRLILSRNSERTYCRFFKDGVYIDRLFIQDATLMVELHPLIGEGDEIDATGIAKLKQLYLASDTHTAVDTL
jgi:hypothetical protein